MDRSTSAGRRGRESSDYNFVKSRLLLMEMSWGRSQINNFNSPLLYYDFNGWWRGKSYMQRRVAGINQRSSEGPSQGLFTN